MAGKKGRSGRKSHYQEKSDAAALSKMFFEPMSQEALEKRIRAGRFSIKDRYLLTAMEGDTIVLTKMFSKVFPDKTKLSGDKDGDPIEISGIEIVFKGNEAKG